MEEVIEPTLTHNSLSTVAGDAQILYNALTLQASRNSLFVYACDSN